MKRRVLCIEDHVDTLDFVESELSAYDVVRASTSDDALELIAQGSFDLYLVDVFLPGGSGFDLCRRIHANRPDASIIIWSAYLDPDTREELSRFHDAPILAKPLDASILRETVDRLTGS